MSLWDVDKGSDNRLTPKPNQNDEQTQRMAHNTMSTTYKIAGTADKQRIAFKNNLMLTYDSNDLISSVYGYIPAVSTVPVFIIAKAGFDVFTDILGIDRPTV